MSVRLGRLWEGLRSSYWFLPSVMALGAVALAFGMIQVDKLSQGGAIEKLGWIYTGGPDGARAVLSVVAGSVMSTAGVTFSITIAALSLASSQFGPRLLSNFMRDTGNQVVLGTFLATFIYCLLVLRTVVGGDEAGRFVPNYSVTLGVALGLASLGVLIFFIHHVAVSIQAPNIVAEVGEELHHSIDRLYPRQIGQGGSAQRQARIEDEVPPDFEHRSTVIGARRSGYLQAVEEDEVMDIARKYDLLLRTERRPGDFVLVDEPLVRAWPGDRVDDDLAKRLRKVFMVGARRTQTQDAEFSVNQLVEVAVRALSPGINDPFTAISCLDQLASGLCHLAQREIPSAFRLDDQGKLRVIATGTTSFAGIVDSALNQIRQYGRSSASVTIRLLEEIERVLHCTSDDRYRAILLKHADMVAQGGREAIPEGQDRLDLEARYQAVLRAARS